MPAAKECRWGWSSAWTAVSQPGSCCSPVRLVIISAKLVMWAARASMCGQRARIPASWASSPGSRLAGRDSSQRVIWRALGRSRRPGRAAARNHRPRGSAGRRRSRARARRRPAAAAWSGAPRRPARQPPCGHTRCAPARTTYRTPGTPPPPPGTEPASPPLPRRAGPAPRTIGRSASCHCPVSRRARACCATRSRCTRQAGEDSVAPKQPYFTCYLGDHHRTAWHKTACECAGLGSGSGVCGWRRAGARSATACGRQSDTG